MSTPPPRLVRRHLLQVAAGLPFAAASAESVAVGGDHAAAPSPDHAGPGWDVVRPRPLVFPADHGAHLGFRTEWWYLTGWLDRPGAAPCGVQITFFRTRTAHPVENPSRFAPTQLLFAHAALALPERGRLLHDQRAARGGFGLAGAETGDTRVSIGPWRLVRDADDRYDARIEARGFSLALRFAPPGPPIPQGDRGYSAKGTLPGQASHYYSRPQLAVEGTITVDGPPATVRGRAWLDHEWSSTLLDADAAGWDWIGIDLHDGGSLMAFRIRGRDGRTRWRDIAWRDATGRRLPIGAPADGEPFEPMRHWTSPRSGADWPVAMRLRVAGPGPRAATRTLRLLPLLDDQEVDARASTGGHYWEGAVRLVDGDRDDAPEIGGGYLELTGYASPLSL